MTAMTDKQLAFLDGLQSLINEHDAQMEVTDDGKPWGQHHGVVEVYIPGDGTFRLPTYMGKEEEE